MSLNALLPILGQGSPASPQGPQNIYQQLTPLVLMSVVFVAMYFLMIRPQRQRQKQVEAMLKTLKPGDKVLTSSGILAVVITVKEKSVTIRSADTKIEVLKSAITDITEKAGDNSSES